ncbi:hypothetical protein ACS0TY_032545 [Phlomoides rotata]
MIKNYIGYPPQYQDLGYNNGISYDYNYQTPYTYSHYQEWGNEERKPTLEEILAAYIAQSQEIIARSDEKMEKWDEEMSTMSNSMKNLMFQIGQLASSSYKEPSIEQEEDPSEEEEDEDELNDEEREFCELRDELIEEFKEVDSEPKDQETNEIFLASYFSQIYDEKTNHILPFIVLDDDRSPLEVKEEDKHCLIEEDEGLNEEEPNKERKEDDDLVDEKEEEESPLIEVSNIEQQNQEEANDELKSDMSIFKPLNSSICTFFDNIASLDFILPLESFDYKNEVRAILGILNRGGRKFTKVMEKFVRRRWNVKGKDDRSMLNEKLLDEEAQILKYKGKEDRYPWPFR